MNKQLNAMVSKSTNLFLNRVASLFVSPVFSGTVLGILSLAYHIYYLFTNYLLAV